MEEHNPAFEKIPLSVTNPFSENLRRLAAIFPSIVKDGQVDFDALKEELGEFEEIGKEHYELSWAGKQEAKRTAGEPVIGRTLKYVPEESKDPASTENLYIEGDNLEVLKLLQNAYIGKIKMIYIDPPYNTGNDFVYNDHFAVTAEENAKAEGDVSSEGERYAVNPKTSGKYHANWLSMMYPRLRLAKNLLRDDGVIFISIDDNEVGNLREICDEIFGGDNFVSEIVVINNIAGRSDSKHIAKAHEYALLYQKSDAFISYGLPLSEEQRLDFKYIDEKGNRYQLSGLRKRGANSLRTDRPNMWYPVYYNQTLNQISVETMTSDDWVTIYPKLSGGQDGCWRWGKDTLKNNLEWVEVKLVQGRDEYDLFEKIPLEKNGVKRTTKFKSYVLDSKFTTDRATSEYKKIMEEKSFTSPKSPYLIMDLCRIVSDVTDDIILDFFSGSATTAHAVMQLNAEDGGNRKFIMVQLPEECPPDSESCKAGYKTICDIGKERIRRAGEKIQKEHPDAKIDTGFNVFRLADTNIRWIAAETGQVSLEDAIITSGKDLRDFMPGYTDKDVVYEILLRQYDIPLTAKIEFLNEIGKRTYSVANTLIVCLEENITNEIIERIANIEPVPHKIIFRDSAFGDDISLKENTMMRLDALMQKHSSGGKTPYRVEFL